MAERTHGQIKYENDCERLRKVGVANAEALYNSIFVAVHQNQKEVAISILADLFAPEPATDNPPAPATQPEPVPDPAPAPPPDPAAPPQG